MFNFYFAEYLQKGYTNTNELAADEKAPFPIQANQNHRRTAELIFALSTIGMIVQTTFITIYFVLKCEFNIMDVVLPEIVCQLHNSSNLNMFIFLRYVFFSIIQIWATFNYAAIFIVITVFIYPTIFTFIKILSTLK